MSAFLASSQSQQDVSPAPNRREFLRASAVVGAAGGGLTPYFFTAERGVADEFKAKNDRPGVGQIGCGGQGNGITGRARRFGDVVAVCDVDRRHAERSQAQHGGKAEIYDDYRPLLDRKDVQVVTIATPDHWHSKIAIEAMQAGKDVYCEKPLTLTIEEGQQICKVVKATGRVFQVGTQQRSEDGGKFLTAVALAHHGRLGKLQRVTAAIGGSTRSGPLKKEQPPTHLNWDRWLGQTPLVDYIPRRCHYEFRWWYEYSGGKLTDWGAHHVDIASWAMNVLDTGPLTLEGTADHPVPFKDGNPTVSNEYNAAVTFKIRCTYANGIELVICDKTDEFDNGVLIEGTEGRIFVNRGKITGKPYEQLKEHPLPEDALTKLYKGKKPGSHMGNFFECLRTREQPISDVFTHHRILTTCHLANIAIRLGRKLNWDPAKEQLTGDDAANQWLRREQRKGYEIKV